MPVHRNTRAWSSWQSQIWLEVMLLRAWRDPQPSACYGGAGSGGPDQRVYSVLCQPATSIAIVDGKGPVSFTGCHLNGRDTCCLHHCLLNCTVP